MRFLKEEEALRVNYRAGGFNTPNAAHYAPAHKIEVKSYADAGRVHALVRWPVSLEQLLEFFGRQPRIPHDAAHRKCVHRVMAWNRENADTVGHNNVLALPNDPEAGLLQRLDRIKMVDAGNLRHS